MVELQKVDRGRFGCERVGKIAKVFDRPSPAQQPLIHRRVFTPQFGKGDAGVDVRINHSSIERNLVERARQLRERRQRPGVLFPLIVGFLRDVGE